MRITVRGPKGDERTYRHLLTCRTHVFYKLLAGVAPSGRFGATMSEGTRPPSARAPYRRNR